MKKYLRISVAALVASLLISVLPASAGTVAPLISIDLSNPSAAVFTANNIQAFNSDATTFSSNGVSLVNFFVETIGTGVHAVNSSSLQPLVAGTNFTLWSSDSYMGGAARNINFFDVTGTPQTFTAGVNGFTGFAIIDLSTFTFLLPAFGTTGFIYAGNSVDGGNGVPVGTWAIDAIPEPTTTALALVGGMLMIAARRRK